MKYLCIQVDSIHENRMKFIHIAGINIEMADWSVNITLNYHLNKIKHLNPGLVARWYDDREIFVNCKSQNPIFVKQANI